MAYHYLCTNLYRRGGCKLFLGPLWRPPLILGKVKVKVKVSSSLRRFNLQPYLTSSKTPSTSTPPRSLCLDSSASITHNRSRRLHPATVSVTNLSISHAFWPQHHEPTGKTGVKPVLESACCLPEGNLPYKESTSSIPFACSASAASPCAQVLRCQFPHHNEDISASPGLKGHLSEQITSISQHWNKHLPNQRVNILCQNAGTLPKTCHIYGITVAVNRGDHGQKSLKCL